VLTHQNLMLTCSMAFGGCRHGSTRIGNTLNSKFLSAVVELLPPPAVSYPPTWGDRNACMSCSLTLYFKWGDGIVKFIRLEDLTIVQHTGTILA
jgi:hypothetical protein